MRVQEFNSQTVKWIIYHMNTYYTLNVKKTLCIQFSNVRFLFQILSILYSYFFFYLLPYKYIKKEVPIPQHLIATLHNTMRRIIIRRRYFEFTRKNKNFIQIMQNIDSLWNPFSFNYNQSKVFVLTRLCIVLCNVY